MQTRRINKSLSGRGFTMLEFLIGLGIVVVIGGIIYAGIDGATCEGNCTSVQCSANSPCPLDTNGDGVLDECIAGTMCAAGVQGTVCEDNWGWFDDCICANKIPSPGACKAACVKP